MGHLLYTMQSLGHQNPKSLWLDRPLVLHKYRCERYCLATKKLFLSITLKSVYSSNTNKTFGGTHFNTVYGKHLASETFG